MTNSSNLIRTLATYGLVLPIALIIGYALATPMDLTTWILLALVLMALSTPFFLKYHRPILFLFWNTTAVAFFFPGRPQVWFVMAFASLGVLILEKAMIRDIKLIRIPSLLFPLLFLTIVIFVTAKVRGGFGLAMFGGDTAGGRRYLTMFAGIVGFFAMTSTQIPPTKAVLYTGLFFLGSMMNAMGGLVNVVGPAFHWIFWLFPVDALPGDEGGALIGRSYGTTLAALGVALYLLARYGVKGVLFAGKPLRLILLLLVSFIILMGGYRTFFLLLALTGFLSAYFEGLLTSKYALGLALAGILGAALIVPLAPKLPLQVQRTLSVLPIGVSQAARESARGSNEWRLRMWETLLPEVPEYLWMGKGLGIDVRDFQLTRALTFGNVDRAYEGAKMAGDFHNGPLTVLINFGIWGAIGWFWFLWAAFRALHRNYLYGDPFLKTVNVLLLAYFTARVLVFFIIFGSFHTDLAIFLGIVALSISLNGGIRTPGSCEALSDEATLKSTVAV